MVRRMELVAFDYERDSENYYWKNFKHYPEAMGTGSFTIFLRC